MKNVGLVTYYGNNYGGCLQAFALQKVLRELGCGVKILPVNTFDGAERGRNVLRAAARVLRNPVAFLKRRRYMKADTQMNLLRDRAFDRFREKWLDFDSAPALTRENLRMEEGRYDALVCGSDQIWNPNLFGVHPVWTLGFAPQGCRKIAYAPSLGVSSIAPEYEEGFREALKDFTFLSCREKEGAEALGTVLGREVDTVLDPTLLLSSAQWRGFAEPVEVKKPYVFCYLFGSYGYIGEAKRAVREATGLSMVSLPYDLREMKSDDVKLYDITPNQFVWLVENAELVLTDSFHASVFSIKMGTPLISLKRSSDSDRKNMNSRLYTLLGTVGMEERMVGEDGIGRIQELIGKRVDFEAAEKRIGELAARDIEKLKTAIYG